jgi:hypothetical protein
MQGSDRMFINGVLRRSGSWTQMAQRIIQGTLFSIGFRTRRAQCSRAELETKKGVCTHLKSVWWYRTQRAKWPSPSRPSLCTSSVLQCRAKCVELNGVFVGVRIKREDLRNRWPVHEMVQEVQNYELKWTQHVLRTPANRLPRKLLRYKPHGCRDLGKQHCRWIEQFL